MRWSFKKCRANQLRGVSILMLIDVLFILGLEAPTFFTVVSSESFAFHYLKTWYPTLLSYLSVELIYILITFKQWRWVSFILPLRLVGLPEGAMEIEGVWALGETGSLLSVQLLFQMRAAINYAIIINTLFLIDDLVKNKKLWILGRTKGD